MDNLSSSGMSAGQQTTELYVKKVLAGSIGDVRARLINSIEAMGYDIIEDDPNIVGRRGAKGWGTWFGSADVLDYQMTLIVRLKYLNENSTRVTFDYAIKHPMLNQGEKEIVVQEAKTIASLSKRQAIEKTCSVCETESTDDSRFCRKCGAALTSEQAELEVLRMMAEVRAGKTSVVSSSILLFASLILLIAVPLLNNAGLLRPSVFAAFFSIGAITAMLALFSTFFGWNRLKRALGNPENPARQAASGYAAEAIKTGEFHELRAPVASITEGTTNLLDKDWRNSREKVPVGNRRDTNSFD